MELLRGDATAEVLLEGNDQGLAAGQYASFYQDGVCLGAAVILGDACPAGEPFMRRKQDDGLATAPTG